MLRPLFIYTFVFLIPIVNGCEYIGSDRLYRAGKRRAPAGYEYIKNEKGDLVRDNDGNPLFRKIGAPSVSVRMGTGFAPTPEEYERYKQLMEDKYQLEKEGDFTKAQQIAEEIAQLKETAKREIPLVEIDFNHIIYNYSYLKDTTEAENACNALHQTFRAAYKAHGLEHLLSPNGDNSSEDNFQFNPGKHKPKKRNINAILFLPPGYEYDWNISDKSEELAALDRAGNHVLRKLGEPSVNVSIRIEVPPEGQKRINLLKEKQSEMITGGNDLAAKQIASEIAYLEYKLREEVVCTTSGMGRGKGLDYFKQVLEMTRTLIREVSSCSQKRTTGAERQP